MGSRQEKTLAQETDSEARPLDSVPSAGLPFLSVSPSGRQLLCSALRVSWDILERFFHQRLYPAGPVH